MVDSDYKDFKDILAACVLLLPEATIRLKYSITVSLLLPPNSPTGDSLDKTAKYFKTS